MPHVELKFPGLRGVTILRYRSALAGALLIVLPGCVSERHFVRDSWPFGNPNAPVVSSETGQRVLGQTPAVTPITSQPGNVWPGPVQPVPTIADVEKNMNQPLGQDDTPSLPSPYGLSPDPNQKQDNSDSSDYSIPAGAVPQIVPASPAPAQ
jgi:hypothetical protein